MLCIVHENMPFDKKAVRLKWLGIGRYLVGRCLWSEVCALGHSGAALPRFGSGRGSGGALSFVCSWLCWGLRYFRHFN